MAEGGFEIILLEPAREFLISLPMAAREKINYNLLKVASGIKDRELFKKLDGSSEIWEFRTLFNGLQYRMLSFWDKDTRQLVVVTHGIVKKTWKVPRKEIAKAEALMKKYYESK